MHIRNSSTPESTAHPKPPTCRSFSRFWRLSKHHRLPDVAPGCTDRIVPWGKAGANDTRVRPLGFTHVAAVLRLGNARAARSLTEMGSRGGKCPARCHSNPSRSKRYTSQSYPGPMRAGPVGRGPAIATARAALPDSATGLDTAPIVASTTCTGHL